MVSPPDLEELFATFEHEAFRLETLPEYRIEPEWTLFSNAQSGDIVTEYPWPEWLDKAAQITSGGRAINRMMVSKAPPTAFFEFRLHEYRRNAMAGEDVRVVFTNDIPITGDFWLFDEKIAAILRFDAIGRSLGVDITDEQGLISDLIELKADLEDWGEPIGGYWDRYIGGAADISSVLH